MIPIRTTAGWRRTLNWALAICLTLTVPGFAQAPPGEAKPSSSSPTPRRGDTGGPVQFVVDTTVKQTWKDADFKRLAEAYSGPKWKNRYKEDVPSVPLWTLLKEGGLSRDVVKKVQIHSRSKLLASFEGNDLGKLDQLVLRTGDQPNRPWRLSSMDPKDPNPYGRAVIRRIEVSTAATTK